MNTERPENLRREISFAGVGVLAINGLIGAGIFALPAAAAERAGDFSPMMFVLCGVLFSTIVLSMGQAASYFRGTGGPVLYAQTAFGSLVGFQTGWLLYLGRVTAMAANTNALVSYAALFWDGFNLGWGRLFAILAVCLLFTTVNVLGVREGMRTTHLLTILKLSPLLLFIGIGLTHIQPGLFVHAEPPSLNSFAGTLLLLVYAYVGFEGALVTAGESQNPKRHIPRALLLTLGVTALLYVLIQTVSVAVLPGIESSKTPLADAAGKLIGVSGVRIMTLAALLSIAGNLSSIMVVAPRMTYALARDNSLPNWFAKVHDRYKTPSWSIIFLGGFAFVLAVSGSFVWLAIMSSLARMIGYAVCILSLPRLKKLLYNPKESLSLPGGFLIPAVALLLCIWLAIQADRNSWLMTAGFVLIGLALFFVSRRVNRV